MTNFRKLQCDYLNYLFTGVSCSPPLGLTPPVELRGPPLGLSKLRSPPCSLSYCSFSLSISITGIPCPSPEQLLGDVGGGTGKVRVKLPRVGNGGQVQVGETSQHDTRGGAGGITSPPRSAADRVADSKSHEHDDEDEAHDDHEDDEHVPEVGADVEEQRVGLHGSLDVEGDGRYLLSVHVRGGAYQLTIVFQGAAFIAEVGSPGRKTESANESEDSEINLILAVINLDILPIYVMASCSLSVLFVRSQSSVCSVLSPPCIKCKHMGKFLKKTLGSR